MVSVVNEREGFAPWQINGGKAQWGLDAPHCVTHALEAVAQLAELKAEAAPAKRPPGFDEGASPLGDAKR